MNDSHRRLAPSILSAEFTKIHEAISMVETHGGDWVHLDVMDGSFVPPITFGHHLIRGIRKLTNLPLDAHLMTVEPARHIQSFADAGVDRFTFHWEAETHIHRVIQAVRDAGMAVGISIVPSTPVSALIEVLPLVEQVLVMTVNPGWGGQVLIPRCLEKVSSLVRMRRELSADFLIQVDGGVNAGTASDVWTSGVDVAVVGSAFFLSEDPKAVLDEIRSA